MKIAIIGASGEIGARLTQQLFNAGMQPRAISRSLSPRLGRYDRLDFRVADLLDRQRLQESLKGCDVAINCAVDKSSPTDTSRAVKLNMQGCQNLLDAAQACGVQRIVHLSSIVVWPPRITTSIISHPTDSLEKDWYTRVKIATEKLMLQPAQQGRVIVVRPGIVYGPYMNWSRHVFAKSLKGLSVLPSGASRCYAVHVDDVVGLIIHLAGSSVTGPSPVWAINPEACTWKDFIETHAKAIGHVGDSAIQVPPDEIKSHCNSWQEGPSFSMALLTWLYRSPLFPEGARKRCRDAKEKFGWSSLGQSHKPPAAEGGLLWPSAFDFEMFSCDGEFDDLAVGYDYVHDLQAGTRSAAQWWQWECTVTAQSEVSTVQSL